MKNALPRPTVRSLAAHLGLSAMTISRALRGARGVSAKTAARVQRVARELGYQLNPAASALMSNIRRHSVANYRGKIACLYAGSGPHEFSAYAWLVPLHNGIKDRAEQSGYIFEDVWLNDHNLQARRLTTILTSRGIQGLIVMSLHPSLTYIDWARFACATTRPSASAPAMHLACMDYMHSVRESFVHLRRHGYTRIGLMLHAAHDRDRNRVERAVYLEQTSELPAHARLPVLTLPDQSQEETELRVAFGNWARRYKPDAVICCDEHALKWAAALGIAVPGELGLVHLNRHTYLTQWAGIETQDYQIGAAAVDLVVGQLNHGELGIPRYQKEVLIKGVWVDGSSLRPQQAGNASPPVTRATSDVDG